MPENLLVPGRECGDCTACCHALSVDAPTMTKPNGVTCTHRCNTGCSIYDHRPDPCRDWYCAWRLADTLGDEWRPDRSGFLVEILFDNDSSVTTMPSLQFTLLRSTADLRWPPFVNLVTSAIAIGQPAFLCLVGPPGYLPARTLLNVPAFSAAIGADDHNAVYQCLNRAGEILEMHHWERKSA